jgi:hypothetical protein
MNGCYTEDLSMFQGIIALSAIAVVTASKKGREGRAKSGAHAVLHRDIGPRKAPQATRHGGGLSWADEGVGAFTGKGFFSWFF